MLTATHLPTLAILLSRITPDTRLHPLHHLKAPENEQQFCGLDWFECCPLLVVQCLRRHCLTAAAPRKSAMS